MERDCVAGTGFGSAAAVDGGDGGGDSDGDGDEMFDREPGRCVVYRSDGEVWVREWETSKFNLVLVKLGHKSTTVKPRPTILTDRSGFGDSVTLSVTEELSGRATELLREPRN